MSTNNNNSSKTATTTQNESNKETNGGEQRGGNTIAPNAPENFMTVSLLGEMYRLRKRQYQQFNEALEVIAEHWNSTLSPEENRKNIRRQYVVKHGDKQGKVVEL